MDHTETLAEAFLKSLGYSDSHVVFEPDGNVPPDFLIKNRIAVEVRRLNQNFEDGNGFRGLEEDSVPLHLKIRKALKSLGPPSHGRSYFVWYQFRRPVPDWKELRKELVDFLSEYRERGDSKKESARLCGSFQVDVFPTDVDFEDLFVPAGDSDHDSGGWMIPELERNLNLIVKEKTEKISVVRAKYPEWWLVLVDHVSFGLSPGDQAAFRKAVSITHDWNRIILLNPSDPTKYFEV